MQPRWIESRQKWRPAVAGRRMTMGKVLSIGKVAVREPSRVPTGVKVALATVLSVCMAFGGVRVWFYDNYVHPTYFGSNREALDRVPMTVVSEGVQIGPIDRRPGDVFTILCEKESGDWTVWAANGFLIPIPAEKNLVIIHPPEGTRRIMLLYKDSNKSENKVSDKFLYL
jgi:hypothetical protein